METMSGPRRIRDGHFTNSLSACIIAGREQYRQYSSIGLIGESNDFFSCDIGIAYMCKHISLLVLTFSTVLSLNRWFFSSDKKGTEVLINES